MKVEIALKVADMSGEGRSKVCYVGGWAIHKIITKYQWYINANMLTLNPATISNCFCEARFVLPLLIPFVKLEQNSQHPETLHVTEGHQYRERELPPITDDVYQFFMTLIHEKVRNVEY